MRDLRPLDADPLDTWVDDGPAGQREPTVATDSVSHQIARVSRERDELLAAVEQGHTDLTPGMAARLLTVSIQAMQVHVHSVHAEIEASTTTAAADCWRERRIAVAAADFAGRAQARSEAAGTRAMGHAEVALDAASRALRVEDRATVRAQDAARLIVREEMGAWVAEIHAAHERQTAAHEQQTAAHEQQTRWLVRASALLAVSCALGGVVLGVLLA